MAFRTRSKIFCSFFGFTKLVTYHSSNRRSFIKQAIIPTSGNTLVQFPYRAMNDLNSYSTLRFEVEPEECESWKAFADGIRESQSWSSDWFATARRFFLCGGAKEFNPKWEDVDRIVDYATALESTLVPEKDYNTRRISRRAAALIAPDNLAETEVIVRFIKILYEIRSRIAHGSRLSHQNREWLLENCSQVELRVRQALVTAVQQLPPGEEDRRFALSCIVRSNGRGPWELCFREVQRDQDGGGPQSLCGQDCTTGGRVSGRYRWNWFGFLSASRPASGDGTPRLFGRITHIAEMLKVSALFPDLHAAGLL